MRQKDLATSLSLDSSSIVRTLDELQAAGLIERREGADRRAKTIHLTALGHATVKRVEVVSGDIRDVIFQGLSDHELEAAFKVLEHICQALSATIKEDAG